MSELEVLRRRVRELEDVNRRLSETEASLRASDGIIRRILETVPGGIVHVGPVGDIRLANRKAQEILGLSFDELTARFTVDFAGDTFFEDGRPCPVEEYPVSRCLVTGEPQAPVTIGVKQRDGSMRWAIFTALPVELEDGRGAVVTFVDITDRRATEKERETMGRRLAHAERLASLGTLAAGLAHELNNPLTFLLGNLELSLMELPEGDPLVAQLEDARVGAERIARIVKDIGAFARRDSEQIRPFDLSNALEEALRLSAVHHRHRASTALFVEPGCVALGQEWRAVQVFVHLLSNAALACPEGKADAYHLRVTAQRVGDRVVVEVADNGCGMTPDELSRAFVPFFTTRPPGDGTGLGLSISHGIVAGMGGDIELVSELGVGTTARVRLPATDERPAAVSAGRGRSTATSGAVAGRLRILVVDDERSIRGLARAALSKHEVVAVGSGREALEACAEADFDAILLDLMMPELTGADVLRALRERAPQQAERVVLMTGGAYTSELRSFLDVEVAPLLAKPFTFGELQAVLAAASKRGR